MSKSSISNTHTMAAARAAVFLQLILIMKTIGLSTCRKFRPLSASTTSRCSFQFQFMTSAPCSASSASRRWRSSAAYGRTTFRHIRGDVDSWRMTSSPDESSSSVPSSSAASASLDLGSRRGLMVVMGILTRISLVRSLTRE